MSRELGAERLRDRTDLPGPLVQRGVLVSRLGRLRKVQHLRDLVDLALEHAVQDQPDRQRLDLILRDVQRRVGGEVGDGDGRVRLDELEQDLGADGLEEILDVDADEEER